MPLPDYSLTKIYKIVSNQTDEIYIGSTCQNFLSKRMAGHKQDYKKYLGGKKNYITSFELLKYDDAKIVLLQSYPECKSKEEQVKYEQEWLDKMICVNKNRSYLTKEQKTEYKKQYRINNVEKLKQYDKEYKKNNLEKIQKNKKEYYKNNAEKIKQHIAEKIECECGRMITRGEIAKHRKRPIHLNNLLKTTNCFS